MITRPAQLKDLKIIKEIYTQYECNLDTDHLKTLMVAIENDQIIAVGCITTVLEVSFLSAKDAKKPDRIDALKEMLNKADKVVADLGYNSYHSFCTNTQLTHTLKKHFSFEDAAGQNLIKWVV